MRKSKKKYAFKPIFFRFITAIVVLCLMLLTFEVITTGKDGRRQIVDENGGVEVNMPANVSVDKENGGSIQ